MPGVHAREVCQTNRTSPPSPPPPPPAFGIPCQGYNFEKYAKLKERHPPPPPAFGIPCQGYKVEEYAKLKEPHVLENRNVFASMTNFQASPTKQTSLKLEKRPPNHTVVQVAAGTERWITIIPTHQFRHKGKNYVQFHNRTWGWREVQFQKAKMTAFSSERRPFQSVNSIACLSAATCKNGDAVVAITIKIKVGRHPSH